MRLIYAYIEEFRNIRKQEFNFVPGYSCSFRNNTLTIEKFELDTGKRLLTDDFVSRISIIVGKTGAGKTNLLQLIGMSPDERTKYYSDCRYFLLYEVDAADNRFAIETNKLFPKGIATGKPIKSPAYIAFSYVNGKITRSSIKDEKTDLSTIIVNSFQRDALRDNYFNNVHYDNTYHNGPLIPRYIQPYDRTNAAYACMFVQDYIKDLPEENVKRDAMLKIRALNWFRKSPIQLDKQLLDEEYWFYHDFINDDGINGVLDVPLFFDRNVRDDKNLSNKEKFIHDLLTDYALYLRKWASIIRPLQEHQLLARRAMGIIVENGVKDCHLLPDGKCPDLKKRINWLCQYLDLHTDEMNGNKGLIWQIGTDIIEIAEAFEQFDEEYFEDGCFSCYVEDIEMDNHSFYQLFERMADFRSDQLGVFPSELLPFAITNLSSGEYQYAKVFGTVFDYTSSKRVRSENYEPPKNIILLLDEPESFMHPEMCRKFVYWMGNLIFNSNKDVNIQVILSTHSPFMLSDVIPEQIIRITYDDTGLCKVLPQNETPSYGGNIYSIMANEFFLDYTIGEMSRIHISKIISILNSILEKDKMEEDDFIQAEILSEVVPYIGDNIIQEGLARLITNILGKR